MAYTVKELIAALDSVGNSPELSNAERLEVTDALRRNLNRLQMPFERAWHFTLANSLTYAAVKTVMDLGLFKAWAAAGGGEHVLDELAKMCNRSCSPNLLRRILRLLVAQEVVEETGPNTFKTNAFSASLAEQNMHLTMRCSANTWFPMALHIPEHLASIDYQDPTDAENTAYIHMLSNPEKLSFFARCRWRPEHQEDFVAGMSNITQWKQDWTEYFDTAHLVDKEVVEKGKTNPIFVDVGGNAGSDVTRFLKKHPEVPQGSLILQDVPDVVEMAKNVVDPKIVAESYDFFKPQPILHSRIYFMHSILHDWPDELALQILGNLKAAFQKGYSRLVVVDVVLPADKASTMQATHDICLMGLLSARERTEEDWTRLLEAGGFRVLKVWKDTRGIESVIEAELADE
ncbi:unnamed protein product [Discula destructiva]